MRPRGEWANRAVAQGGSRPRPRGRLTDRPAQVTSGDIQDTRLPTQLLLAISGVELAEYERQSQQDAAALRHTAAFLEEQLLG